MKKTNPQIRAKAIKKKKKSSQKVKKPNQPVSTVFSKFIRDKDIITDIDKKVERSPKFIKVLKKVNLVSSKVLVSKLKEMSRLNNIEGVVAPKTLKTKDKSLKKLKLKEIVKESTSKLEFKGKFDFLNEKDFEVEGDFEDFEDESEVDDQLSFKKDEMAQSHGLVDEMEFLRVGDFYLKNRRRFSGAV